MNIKPATNQNYTILLFYKFIDLGSDQDLEEMRKSQARLWEELNLKGRLIIAREGINGTLEGSTENTAKYIESMHVDPRFDDLWFKLSNGTGNAFKKASIKVREEVCALGRPDLNPMSKTAQHITHDELHRWYEEGKEFYIVDMRNDYEYEVGRFDNSISIENVKHFRDIPENLDSIAHLKEKAVVTFCTGGIRCDKGSGLLLEAGFKEVYQLDGGIHTYLVHYPDGFFRGKLYVFDGRVVVSFGGKTDEVIGTCKECGNKTENFVNIEEEGVREHFLMCQGCVIKHRDRITFVSNT